MKSPRLFIALKSLAASVVPLAAVFVMALVAADAIGLAARTHPAPIAHAFPYASSQLAPPAPLAPQEGSPQKAATRFEISFPAAAHATSITGRMFVMLTPVATTAAAAPDAEAPEPAPAKAPPSEPRTNAGDPDHVVPIFGVDVSALAAGQPAVVDAATPGFPMRSLNELPAGDYNVQGLVNIYTEFHRSDGRTVWLHMDQWEGQQFNISPGNLYSEVRRVHLDPAAGYDIRLSLTRVIPPIKVPADTQWVKHIKIQSEMLTKFWGHPMYIGATVLLPKGYDEHPAVRYPVIYLQGHFTLGAPFGLSTEDTKISAAERARLANLNHETGYELYQSWNSEGFPRAIAVTFQHPTPYYDDSYAVNSLNNGPYGDALVQEIIPYLEAHFRIIAQPYARVLIGGSTGGWEALGVQVFYPDFFGGTWVFYPDPVDFRRLQMTNIYTEDNMFWEPGHTWIQAPRYMERKADGQPEVTMQQMSQLAAVLGSHERSGQQFEIWDATYGPVGDDGYPKPLWDKQTGKIDHSVALYERDHGYDLSYNLRTHWSTLGPKLHGKIHVFVGDMDFYYLNLAVYLLEGTLKSLQNPPCDCEFQYGRPMKGHGWQPTSTANMIREMADFIAKHAPAGENTSAWHY